MISDAELANYSSMLQLTTNIIQCVITLVSEYPYFDHNAGIYYFHSNTLITYSLCHTLVGNSVVHIMYMCSKMFRLQFHIRSNTHTQTLYLYTLSATQMYDRIMTYKQCTAAVQPTRTY